MSAGPAVGAVDELERRRDPDFVIVGTSRSGTTLVQRLACGLEGVRVPPETHFRLFAKAVAGRRTFPLDAPMLREELRWYARQKNSRGLPLDPDAIVDDLAGRCDSVWDLFSAIVRQLAGPAPIVGEKTPEHVRWWLGMTRRYPELKVICIVREPRDVVASNLGVPFAPKTHVILAERWKREQGQVRAAREELGPDRCLVLRYEDVVADPAAGSDAIAALLGTRAAPADVDPSRMYHDWEWWKHRTMQPITEARIGRWRDVLTPRQAATVRAIARPHLEVFGYGPAPAAISALVREATIGPHDRARLRIFHRAWTQELAFVDRMSR